MAAIQFKDHFSTDSPSYSRYRPTYPSALFSYLASLCSEREIAWDCATGTGQSAATLAEHFAKVIATDASDKQIQHVIPIEGVEYRVASAESSGIEPDTINLITVSQALHWFDIEAFLREVDRVLKAGGVLAIWSYELFNITPEIDEKIYDLYATILGDYWPKERALVDNGYRDIQLPFKEIDVPKFKMLADWSCDQLIGYLGTWSAVKRYQEALAVNPITAMVDELLAVWGKLDTREISWAMSVRVCRKT